jgi:hypothetical protein
VSKSKLNRDSLKLKAAIEFGSENIYTIRDGGLGPTLVVDAETRSRARTMREKIPTDWEGLYTIVVYCTEESEEDFLEDALYDPK